MSDKKMKDVFEGEVFVSSDHRTQSWATLESKKLGYVGDFACYEYGDNALKTHQPTRHPSRSR